MAPELAVNSQGAGDSDAPAAEILAAVEFRVELAWDHDAVRVSPVGEVDLATIARLRTHTDEAMAAGAGRVILDLRKTTFVDSSMLHLVVEICDWAARTETQLAIVPGPPATQRTFEVAGLSDRLPFVDVPRA